MSRARSFLSAALACLPLMTFACGSSGGGTATQSVTCTDGTMIANEANDYSFTSSLMLHPVKVKPMSDLTFNWGGVTKDFLGQPVNAQTDLNTIFLLLVNLPAATFEMQLNNDTFATSSIVIPGPPPSFLPTGGVTMTTLYDNFMGAYTVDASMAAQYLDASTYTPANSTFVLGGADRNGHGRDRHSDAAVVRARLLVDQHDCHDDQHSTTLSYSANLHSLHPTGVPAGTPNLTLDWSQIQTNALGQPFVATNIANAIVGHYTQTPSQLESQFLDLQTIATDLYKADIPSGTVLDFTTLVDQKTRASRVSTRREPGWSPSFAAVAATRRRTT